MSIPTVLFVCVHNAGRSQMAAAFLTTLGKGQIEVRSAGSQPAQHVNPVAVQAMAEDGIDITAPSPGPSPRKLSKHRRSWSRWAR